MKDTQLTIRINSELKQAAQTHAKDTGRTLAGLIEWLLRQELKKKSDAGKPAVMRRPGHKPEQKGGK